ncbi:MAG: DUF362 domain-containing protein [Chloroflexi bacterium]|nr:DUF362 domain-containing protein [Chloroflexota bacterium]
MIFDADNFVFSLPSNLASARRVLIKPNAAYALPHPVTTSRETLFAVILGIRKVSDADIIILEESDTEEPAHNIYRLLGYDFPRVIMLDVRDCVYVEVENPLSKPFALSTMWVPNVVLSCDYLISVASFKVFPEGGSFTVKNLIGLLPRSKYHGKSIYTKDLLHQLGLPNVVADLYFTLPFDCGIIDARMMFKGEDDPTFGQSREFGKIFVGEPYEVDLEGSRTAGVTTKYLELIREVKEQVAVSSSRTFS